MQNLNRNDSYSQFSSVPASYSFEIKGADLSLEQVDMTITYKALLPLSGNRTQGFTLASPVKIALTAPDGTEAFMDLLPTSSSGIYSSDTQSFTFGFRNFMGASPNGTWTLKAESSFNTLLTINTVQVDLHGGSTNVNDVHTYTDEFFTMAAIAGEQERTTLSDTNGGIDWINAAAISSDAQISLVEGETSRFAGRDAYTIAKGSAIENAVSGDGNDRLTGNSLDNKLYGMRGADRLNGGAGDDTLFGGSGDDVFVFDTQGASGHDKILDWSAGDRIATTKQLRGADSDGQITLGANGTVLLDGTVRGDTVDLVGHGGAVLQAMGKSDGYWWYAFVSDGSNDAADGRVRELALGMTDHAAYDASASSAAGTASTMHVSDGPGDHPFYLYNAMHDVMSTGVQVYA
ncbi:Ca2+-binding RTX toxin-like protein [Sphingomonas sp. BE138]|uniref:calcium-binding protein n=1 Tax=Sphingomonas sp. BE138 TaxID=2817845 RepID=UPI002860F2C0|nr:M10 family metallopeptidase C-terminal domain-containing protein [Sphingomonas sp. BE138]MDR6787557.1 Ca2+-binding RTX toxin-like protein [Sphingomonas sp. BE138]